MIGSYFEYFVFLLISVLLFATVGSSHLRKKMTNRKLFDWIVEIASLVNHFLIIPFSQSFIVVLLLKKYGAAYGGILGSSVFISLILYALLDYGWYWNHRILHSRTKLWNFHMVHHSAEHLDVLSTPRNSLFSPFLMVYFWLAPVFIFLLEDASWFLAFSAIGLMVNFWGHTEFNFRKDSKIQKALSVFLITPHEHFWHHSRENSYCNFGTVFNFWDRIHKTWYSPDQLPDKLGFEVKMSKFRQLLFPW